VRAVLPSQNGLPCAVCRRKSLRMNVSQATSTSARAPRSMAQLQMPLSPTSHARSRLRHRGTTTPRRSRVVIAVVRKAPPTVRRDPTARWSRPTPEATPRGAQSRPGDRSAKADRPARKISRFQDGEVRRWLDNCFNASGRIQAASLYNMTANRRRHLTCLHGKQAQICMESNQLT
jgi:hypothetical protein